MKKIILKDINYTIEDIYNFSINSYNLSLSKVLVEKINKSRELVDIKSKSDNPIYGINTGFGKLSQIKIDKNDLKKLQINLLESHAVGVGNYVPDNIVKIMILLKIISFCHGNSGVNIKTVDLLLALFNNDCIPQIPSQGSVGASGDLAPLAHLALCLVGNGKIKYKNKVQKASFVLKKINYNPIELESKEGLALINGTQFSTAYAVFCLKKIKDYFKLLDLTSAMTIEALQGSKAPFLNFVNKVKPYKGQQMTAENIINILKNSQIMDSHKNCDRVQDMYSLRCIPQVHGSSRDLIEFSCKQVNTEINSVSDNPLVFSKRNKIVSAGHFHAESIAHSLDIAAISISSVSSISERRIFSLLAGNFGLPEFLVDNPGLNSGFMMLQVTAAALASENKLLANPSSTDTIPTCSNQEDHVSMAPYSGRKLLKSIENFKSIIAIELLCACQGIDFRLGLRPAKLLNYVHQIVRKDISFLKVDRLLKNDLEKMSYLIDSGTLLDKVSKKIKIL
tara:strand:+ start:451 stop:1974 length:1524 start_codon:yes stop_codon:yes gene_type:complete